MQSGNKTLIRNGAGLRTVFQRRHIHGPQLNEKRLSSLIAREKQTKSTVRPPHTVTMARVSNTGDQGGRA